MNFINNSVLDIFKIGPGPSSSHTIAPMLAANDFAERFVDQGKIEVHFYGSLALTGKGHGSDRAVISGFLGERPETCNTAQLAQITLDANNSFTNEKISVQFFFHKEKHNFPFQNTLIIKTADGAHSETYYSIGGGFLQKAFLPPTNNSEILLPYRYKNFDGFQKIARKNKLSPTEIILANEAVLKPQVDVRAEMLRRLKVMIAAVERGLRATGKLPGHLGVNRRAKKVYQAAMKAKEKTKLGEHILFIDAYALAAAEENAAGNLVVTAPTSGASGLIPGIVYYLYKHQNMELEKIIDGLLIAGVVGLIARTNASISGAEVGCQGEVGVASAMAAAMLAQINDGDLTQIENAAEIALEHHLGLTCDPVGGYVQIPCIERNAIGAVTACNAFLLAQTNQDANMISFDEVLSAMLETGRAMSCAFKETSLGGLANCACCI